MVHVRLNEADFPEPSLTHGLPTELDCRVRTVHVADLHRDVLRAAHLHHTAIRGHVLSARLVAVHRDPPPRTLRRNLHEVAVRHLDKNNVNIRNVPRFRLRDNAIPVRIPPLVTVHRGFAGGVINDRSDLVHITHALERLKLAGSMLVRLPVEKCPQWSHTHSPFSKKRMRTLY